jgi:hypothetical protein
MSDLIFAKYGCLRVGEEFNVVELASKERILFELGANIDYETAELFTEIVK